MNKPGSRGQTALLRCVKKGNEEDVRMLILAGADVNTVGNYCGAALTRLMIAARNGYLNIAGSLIEAGPDVNKTCVNETTLSFFAWKNNVQGV